jgi:hypothetical protein
VFCVIDSETFDLVEGMSKTEINKLWWLSETAVTLSMDKMTATVNVIGANVGTITAITSASSKATVVVDGKKVIITGVAAGSATITVSNSNGGSQLIAVTVATGFPSATLRNNTPAQIQAAARAGIAASLWSVGDRIGMLINGAVGIMNLNTTRYAYILGFDHNAAIEGANTIHFQLGFTGTGSSSVNIAFCDSSYDSSTTTGFCMNTTADTTGGWAASFMRNTICPAFLAAMPSEWQAVISPCTKYTDNVGGSSSTPASVSSTADRIFLLSQFEVTGTSSQYVNPGEEIAQKQYAYFANGNSKIKYKSGATSTACDWWTRTPRYQDATRFRNVGTDGSVYSNTTDKSKGFAPAFMVA